MYIFKSHHILTLTLNFIQILISLYFLVLSRHASSTGTETNMIKRTKSVLNAHQAKCTAHRATSSAGLNAEVIVLFFRFCNTTLVLSEFVLLSKYFISSGSDAMSVKREAGYECRRRQLWCPPAHGSQGQLSS